MTRTLGDGLRWVELGTGLCERALASIPVGRLGEPSELAGWSRAHVVAHLDGNARALTNLVRWATTGIETPMYSSMEQRNADIAAGAVLAEDILRGRFEESASLLADGLGSITDWSAEVRTAQGRTVPVSEVPWMRSREVMVHAVDLLGGVEFTDLPDDLLLALAQDIAAKRSVDGTGPSLLLLNRDGVQVAQVQGVGETVTLSASAAELTAYLSGRDPSLGPALPAWL